MYVIKKITTPCFGRADVPDKYITGTTIISAGEYMSQMTENIHEAQKFKTYEIAEKKIKDICDAIRFYHNLNYEIISF